MSFTWANVTQTQIREKGRDLTQSYDKNPYTNRNVKGAKWQHKQRHSDSKYKNLLTIWCILYCFQLMIWKSNLRKLLLSLPSMVPPDHIWRKNITFGIILYDDQSKRFVMNIFTHADKFILHWHIFSVLFCIHMWKIKICFIFNIGENWQKSK